MCRPIRLPPPEVNSVSIAEVQLETWSHQGSVTQSKGTYATVKRALESHGAAYSGRKFDVFLQGSYGNDTNIYAESDVDVVMCLNSTFIPCLDGLSSEERAAFRRAFPDNATYTLNKFKADVVAALQAAFPQAVSLGSKAIKVAKGGSRRSTDVVAAAQYRRYYGFRSAREESFVQGIFFLMSNGKEIVNYPRQHSANCTAKHQATSYRFKPTVRILKNIRRAMENDGLIDKAVAPSYFLEGLLYNVPNEKFGGSHKDTIVSSINWIVKADRNSFMCANEQQSLLGNTLEAWPAANCDRFLNALFQYGSNWS